MTVYFDKARQKWRYHFEIEKKRETGYCDDPETGSHAENRTDAKRIEAIIRGALLAKQEKPQPASDGPDFTFGQAVAAFAARKQGKGNWANQQVYLNDLMNYFGASTRVAAIAEDSPIPDAPSVWGYIRYARQRPVMVYIGKGRPLAEMLELGAPIERLYRPAKDGRLRADSTINRYLDCLRETLRIAYELRDPRTGEFLFKGAMPKVPDLDEPEYLPRPFTDDEIWEAADRAPPHLAWGILLARLMGFRKAEMFGIRRRQVDFNLRGVWLAAADTKGKRDELVPANAEAMELLEYLVAEAEARGVEHIITYRRRLRAEPGQPPRFTAPVPIKNPKKAFARVLKDMGLDGIHTFHNTKASFVTAIAHVAPAAVTQDLARHKDYRTTQRYLKVVDHAKRAAVEAASIKSHTGSTRTQKPHTRNDKAAEAAAKSLKVMVGATGFEPATPSPPEAGATKKVLGFKPVRKRNHA